MKKKNSFILSVLGAFLLSGCTGALPELNLSQYRGDSYAFAVMKSEVTPPFHQSTVSDDIIKGSKEVLLNTIVYSGKSLSGSMLPLREVNLPERVADNKMQSFLNTKDPASDIRKHAQQVISQNFGWKNVSSGGNFLVYVGTEDWGIKSHIGGYAVYYAANLNIMDKKEHDAVAYAKTPAQSRSALEGRKTSPVRMSCHVTSRSTYSYEEISTNKELLEKEIVEVAHSCMKELDSQLKKVSGSKSVY